MIYWKAILDYNWMCGCMVTTIKGSSIKFIWLPNNPTRRNMHFRWSVNEFFEISSVKCIRSLKNLALLIPVKAPLYKSTIEVSREIGKIFSDAPFLNLANRVFFLPSMSNHVWVSIMSLEYKCLAHKYTCFRDHRDQ